MPPEPLRTPPRVIAHRGGAGLRPENTLAAVAHAIELGAHGIEIDVQRTADGEIVVYHDYRLAPALTRGPGGSWLDAPGPPLRELTLDELGHYDVGRLDPASPEARRHPDQAPVDGERIPTLEQVIDLTGERAPELELWIELKTERARAEATPPDALARGVVELLRARGVESRSLLLSFEWAALECARGLAPQLRRVHTVHRGAHRGGGETVLDEIVARGGHVWFPEHRDVTPRRVGAARARGLRIATWTANEPAELRRLTDLGVDAICTDHPERLLAPRPT